MTITIRTENPMTPDGHRLIDASQAALLEVFPADEVFSFSADELATRNTQFLVARVDGIAMGCVALVDQGRYGEVKRLFVTPAARGLGLARALMQELENAARDIGLCCIRLESGEALTGAMALYRGMGYRDCPAFGGYPDIASNAFLEKTVGALVN